MAVLDRHSNSWVVAFAVKWLGRPVAVAAVAMMMLEMMASGSSTEAHAFVSHSPPLPLLPRPSVRSLCRVGHTDRCIRGQAVQHRLQCQRQRREERNKRVRLRHS